MGSSLPDFALPDLDGRIVTSADYVSARALLVAFFCRHCPFVTHIRQGFSQFAAEYKGRLPIVAINSNDIEAFPEDGPDGMRDEARTAGYTFPYLFDEKQEIAKAFRAACTPDLFLFDSNRRLAYRGEFDDSRPKNNVPVTGAELRAAADAVLAGRLAPATQKPSIGCNIKWYPGNAPVYFKT